MKGGEGTGGKGKERRGGEGMEGEGWGGKGKEGGKRKRRMTAIANFLGPARIQPKALFHDAERDLLATAKFFFVKTQLHQIQC